MIVPTLGELERAVMEALWSADTAVTARDVQDALAGRELATTTVLTVLGRLERKGYVLRALELRGRLLLAAVAVWPCVVPAASRRSPVDAPIHEASHHRPAPALGRGLRVRPSRPAVRRPAATATREPCGTRTTGAARP